jgi:hypothetical protein
MRQMDRDSVFEKFCSFAPFAVMTQIVMRACILEKFSGVFQRARGRQYEEKLSFEDFAIAIADVALGVCRNPNQAYRVHKKKLGVARSRFYDKLNCTNTDVSEEIIATMAPCIAEMQDALEFTPWEGIPGYRLLVVDGNHLEKTDRRIAKLRGRGVAPLPGTAVARFDLGRQIFDRVYLLEDAHQQEAVTCQAIVDDLEPSDVIVADRHYCIVEFMNQLAVNNHFAIRHHARLPGVLLGKRKKLGRIATGTVYEQAMRLKKEEDSLVVRRITIELDEPTQDGDLVIHLLTNLPGNVSGKLIAEVYHRRWEEETAFYYLRMCFNGELPSLGHPRAALFLFAMTLMAYNVLQVIWAAFFATHDDEEVQNISNLYVSQEIMSTTPGMLIILDDDEWDSLIPTSTKQVARLLKQIAKKTSLADYRKSVRKPKPKKPRKKKTKKKANAKHSHLSTAKVIGLVAP